MIQGTGGSTPAESREAGDDTVELVLSDEQSRALSQAAECTATSMPCTTRNPDLAALQTDDLTVRRTARIDRAGNITVAVAIVSIGVACFWPVGKVHDSTTAGVKAPRVAAVRVHVPAESQDVPVRITNAFDTTEVFEFRVGTPESEAREAVARILLSRARDRLSIGRGRYERVRRDSPSWQSQDSVSKLLANMEGAEKTGFVATAAQVH